MNPALPARGPLENEGCPYCGSLTGTPRTVYSREYQGEHPHGGNVEWADECCSECNGRPSNTRLNEVFPHVPTVRLPETEDNDQCPF